LSFAGVGFAVDDAGNIVVNAKTGRQMRNTVFRAQAGFSRRRKGQGGAATGEDGDKATS